MGEDEEATGRALTAYREIFNTLIQQYNRKLIDSPGDNLLVEFACVVDAFLEIINDVLSEYRIILQYAFD